MFKKVRILCKLHSFCYSLLTKTMQLAMINPNKSSLLLQKSHRLTMTFVSFYNMVDEILINCSILNTLILI